MKYIYVMVLVAIGVYVGFSAGEKHGLKTAPEIVRQKAQRNAQFDALFNKSIAADDKKTATCGVILDFLEIERPLELGGSGPEYYDEEYGDSDRDQYKF